MPLTFVENQLNNFRKLENVFPVQPGLGTMRQANTRSVTVIGLELIQYNIVCVDLRALAHV